MKLRQGFVSNSSSSSFTCDVCGCTESGWDACPSDFDWDEFSCGHISCCGTSEISEEDWRDAAEKDLKKMLERPYYKDSKERSRKIQETLSIEDFYEFKDACSYYEISNPQAACPVCNLSSIDDSNILAYVLHKNSQKREDVIKEIKNSFDTLEDLRDHIGGEE